MTPAPEPTAPEATVPEATVPEATAPEAAASEANAPEATAPETTALEASVLVVQLSFCNTLTLPAGQLEDLVKPRSGNHTYNIMNYGPGAIWYRTDGDAAIGNAQSILLLAQAYDNAVPVYEKISIIADGESATITVRLN